MYRPTSMQIVREVAYLNRQARRKNKKTGRGSQPKTMDVLDFAPSDAGYGTVPAVCACVRVCVSNASVHPWIVGPVSSFAVELCRFIGVLYPSALASPRMRGGHCCLRSQSITMRTPFLG